MYFQTLNEKQSVLFYQKNLLIGSKLTLALLAYVTPVIDNTFMVIADLQMSLFAMIKIKPSVFGRVAHSDQTLIKIHINHVLNV